MWLKYFSQALSTEPLLITTSLGANKTIPNKVSPGLLPINKEDHFFTIIFNFYLVNYYASAIQSLSKSSQTSEQVRSLSITTPIDVWDLLSWCVHAPSAETVQDHGLEPVEITNLHLLLERYQGASEHLKEDRERLKVIDPVDWESTNSVRHDARRSRAVHEGIHTSCLSISFKRLIIRLESDYEGQISSSQLHRGGYKLELEGWLLLRFKFYRAIDD